MDDQARAPIQGWQRMVDDAWHQQAGALGIGDVPGARALTPDEAAAIHSVFGDQIDTSKIIITDQGPFTDDNARTFPTDGKGTPAGMIEIEFPPGTLAHPPSDFRSWLIHESTHAWQYQHGASVTDLLPDAIAGNYDYGGEAGLRAAHGEAKPFTAFNHEQQGDILRDYYKRREAGLDTSAWQPYVDSVRNGTANTMFGGGPVPQGQPQGPI